MTEENQQIARLLERNNSLLQELVSIKKKETKTAARDKIINIALTLLPYLLILIVGYYLWSVFMSYLDSLNQNINALKSGYDALTQTISKFIPDMSTIGGQLEQTWQDIQFWN
jgi:hypothetical protein